MSLQWLADFLSLLSQVTWPGMIAFLGGIFTLATGGIKIYEIYRLGHEQEGHAVVKAKLDEELKDLEDDVKKIQDEVHQLDRRLTRTVISVESLQVQINELKLYTRRIRDRYETLTNTMIEHFSRKSIRVKNRKAPVQDLQD